MLSKWYSCQFLSNEISLCGTSVLRLVFMISLRMESFVISSMFVLYPVIASYSRLPSPYTGLSITCVAASRSSRFLRLFTSPSSPSAFLAMRILSSVARLYSESDMFFTYVARLYHSRTFSGFCAIKDSKFSYSASFCLPAFIELFDKLRTLVRLYFRNIILKLLRDLV